MIKWHAKCSCLLAGLAFGCSTDNPPSPPNVVFILIDDMGWKDLGCYGSEFYETPNIDALASEGIRFTDAYSASGVCSPTRASIFTGKSPSRLHLTQWIGPEEWQVGGDLTTPEFEQQLPLEEITFAEVLKENGYTTFFAGKWHLGSEPFYPQHQGFDINIGGNDAGAPPSYFYPYERDNWKGTGWPEKIRSIEGGTPGEYLTDRLTDEALNFLDTIGNRPFLLCLSHYAIHKPLQAKTADSIHFATKASGMDHDGEQFVRGPRGEYTRQYQDHAVNAGMIKAVDESVGRVIGKLEASGLRDNTIIIFTSDNGGVSCATISGEGGYVEPYNICTSVLPLRGGKGWYYEGGIRVPLIVSLPGEEFRAGISDYPVVSYDFFPTLLDLLSIEHTPVEPIDGISFSQELLGQDDGPKRPIFWHYPHYHTLGQSPASAVRLGKYKLIRFYEDGHSELYNLKADPGEQQDLSDLLQEKVSELGQVLSICLERTDASLPEHSTDH